MRRIILALLIIAGIAIGTAMYVIVALNKPQSQIPSPTPPSLVSLLGTVKEEQEYWVTERSPSGGYLGDFAMWYVQPEGSETKYYLAHSGTQGLHKFYHRGDMLTLKWDTGVRFNVTGYVSSEWYELYKINQLEDPRQLRFITIIKVVEVEKL